MRVKILTMVFGCFLSQSVVFADEIACAHRIFTKDRESICIEKSILSLKELGFNEVMVSGISTFGKDAPISAVIACDTDRGVAFVAVAGPASSGASKVCSAIDEKWHK